MLERFPDTPTRVEESTAAEVNEQMRREIEANIAYYSKRIDQIECRLRQLDREWDVERSLETNASIVVLTGLVLGLFRRKFRLIPYVASGFLLWHALKGWCPPVPIMRRMGVRTQREIDTERYALKALRGDFRDLESNGGEDAYTKAIRALRAAE